MKIDYTETYLQYNSVQSEGEPNLYEMSAVNISTGTESRDDRHVNQTSDGSRDIESSGMEQSVQNLDVQIKEEPGKYNTSGSTYSDTEGYIGQFAEYPIHMTGKRDFDVHRDHKFVFRDGTDYAVCIKYEPNSESNPDASVNDVNIRKPDNHDNKSHQDNGHSYHASVDYSHCYVDCRPASNSIHTKDTQAKYGTMKCEIPVHHIKNNVPYNCNSSGSNVNNHHDHNHIFSISYEKINISENDHTNTEGQLTTHEVYRCGICSYSIIMPCHETNNQKDTEKKQYKCDKCSYSSVKPNNLVTHKRKHTREKPYKCDVCSYSTTRSNLLAEHKARHTGEKPYKCDLCSYSTVRSRNLAMHKRKHTKEKPYKCDVCSYSTVRSSDLGRHNRKHTGEKPYKCDVCNYSTVRSHDLVRHKRKHTGEKPYTCDACSFTTTRSNHLAEHQLRHTGEKPYKCDLCSYSTVSFRNLAVHKRKHTGETPYKCDVCSYRAVRSNELVRHKRKHTEKKHHNFV